MIKLKKNIKIELNFNKIVNKAFCCLFVNFTAIYNNLYSIINFVSYTFVIIAN